MPEYSLTFSEFPPIDFGAADTAEVLQNVRMIIATMIWSCPMDREFAWNPDVDAPINIIQAKLTARLVAAVKKYEPRARVTQVTFQGDAMNGVLRPVVRVRVADDS